MHKRGVMPSVTSSTLEGSNRRPRGARRLSQIAGQPVARTFRTLTLKEEQKAHEEGSPHVGLNSYFDSDSRKMKNEKSIVAGTVHVGFRLYSIQQIDHETESFMATFKLFYEWCDPILANLLKDPERKHDDDEKKQEIRKEWTARTPEVQFVNAKHDSVVREDWARPPKVADEATGRMYTFRKYTGVFAERQELHHFPFDVQLLKIKLTLRHAHFENFTLHLLPIEFRDVPQIPGWRILRPDDLEQTESREAQKLHVRPDVTVKLHVMRESGYYTSNILMSLSLLTSLGFISFVLPVGDTNDRVQLCVAVLFTLMALRFATSLPKTSSSTVIDQFENACKITLVFMACIHGVLSGVVVRALTGVESLTGEGDPAGLTSDERTFLETTDLVLGLALLTLWTMGNMYFYLHWTLLRHRRWRKIVLEANDDSGFINWTPPWTKEQNTQRPWSDTVSLGRKWKTADKIDRLQRFQSVAYAEAPQ